MVWWDVPLVWWDVLLAWWDVLLAWWGVVFVSWDVLLLFSSGSGESACAGSKNTDKSSKDIRDKIIEVKSNISLNLSTLSPRNI